MTQEPAAESIRNCKERRRNPDTGPYNVTGGTANQTSSFYRMGSFFISAEALARTGICEEVIRCGLIDETAASNQTQEVNIVYRKVDTNLNFVDREKEV